MQWTNSHWICTHLHICTHTAHNFSRWSRDFC